ncbi:MAG: ferrochelatase [Hyphomicrobiales bacterium]|nr:ferrochelatase [Hyphomicrobiales bacterium]
MENNKSVPENLPTVSNGKVGVLLINLGTPDGYDKKSMRRYLREFLSDNRVIEWSRWLWYPILYGIVLNTRPKKSGAAYEAIWNHQKNESPLRTFTRSQASKLASSLKDKPTIMVDWAMRYGNPSIAEKLTELKQTGCERILIFPLYPQYSASTTATVNDKAFEALSSMRWMPAIRTVYAYHDKPVYIKALAKSIRNHLKDLDFEPEKIIASYHGIPKSYVEKGDPYYDHCLITTGLLREELGWGEDRLINCFQSRFGPEEWLQPYTDETIKNLGNQGIKNVAVFNPGFVCDCLETLEEIAVEAAEIFKQAGGTNFSHIPCLNDSEDGMKVIEEITRFELLGWV